MKTIAVICCLLSCLLHAESRYIAEYEAVYRQIPDIYHPTYKDFLLLENYLNNGARPYLQWLTTFYTDEGIKKYDARMRDLKLVNSNNPKDHLELHTEYINNNPEDREWCVVSYASFNSGHPQKILNMASRFKEVKFSGHFLYRMGGWPDLEGGSLRLAHVPYAFKVCMLKEAQRLGYKKVLWLDTSMKPLKNFDEIFRIIEKDGFFLLSLHNSLWDHGSEISREALHLTEAEYSTAYQVVGGIIGINFDHPQGNAICETWYKAAEDLDPLLSRRPEQVALGAIVYKMGISFTAHLDDVCAIYSDGIDPNHYFHIRY